jgi:hypothetical protein
MAAQRQVGRAHEDPQRIPVSGAQAEHRWERGAWLLRDSTLRRLEILLDEAFRIPGTQIRFGLDGMIGLVPGMGDVLAGLLSLVIPLAGWVRGIPYVALTRMVVNVGIGVVVGAIPLFGDAFDIMWKSNRRNYQILRRHIEAPHQHTWRDWVFLGLLGFAVMVVFLLPIVALLWLLLWIRR